MTKRNVISSKQNSWFDSEQVDNTDLTVEQQYNDTVQSAIINNNIGHGVLSDSLLQNVIFDSLNSSGLLDGIGILAQNQPSDINFGNQLEVQLQNSIAAGKRTVKVALIGLDFQNALQYETFVFNKNETLISKKHFTKILIILFNDFIGDNAISFNLGGRVIIKEAVPASLSRDTLMLSQNIEPNIFFRDFQPSGNLTLSTLLQSALPLYNVDNLNIFTAGKDLKALVKNDVSTQVGQKFKALTTNIQKIKLLLSVQNSDLGQQNDLAWTGDIVVSVYPLQTTITCQTDLAPGLPIDFSPDNIPLAQLSFNYLSLKDRGIILDSVPQPVDFIFSNTPLAAQSALTLGNYYAFTIKRAGSANKCDILITAGNSRVDDSRVTIFNGNLWVDISEEDLWFEIATDAAKLSDGQVYESGFGNVITKTVYNLTTASTVDYSLDKLNFGGNDNFYAVFQSITKTSDPVQDQRTGDPVNSRQQHVPNVNLFGTLDLTNLQKVSDPLLLGIINDNNKKFFDPVASTIISNLHFASVVDNEIVIRIIDDPTDSTRYDTAVNSLISNLLNGDFVNAKVFPDYNNPSIFYRVAKAELVTMLYGDVDGSGIVDENDLTRLNSYLGFNLNIAPPLNTSVTTDGYQTTFTNGYTSYINPFTTGYSISYQVVDPATKLVVAFGSDGVLVQNPLDPRLGQFTSATVNFNTIVGLSNYKLVMLTPSNPENYGGFDITSLDSTADVLTIRKIILNGNTYLELMRSDIDGDGYVTQLDGYLLQSYIARQTSSTSNLTTYPAPATNPYTKIGTRFNAIRLTVEPFVDRSDDYSTNPNLRNNVTHTKQDIFINDGYFASHNFNVSPIQIAIQKQLSWEESLVTVRSKVKLLPSVFLTNQGYTSNSCIVQGVQYNLYPVQNPLDPGRVDQFIPNNLIIGQGGEIIRPDGNFYKVDFEVGTIVLEIPDSIFGSERIIDVFNDFIADYNNTGITQLGFPAMRFSDCSTVSPQSLANGQVSFSVSVQSFSPNNNGLDQDGYAGVIVDGKIGVYMDYKTGLLSLNFTNLYQDSILSTLNTKIQINVFLKKGGFNNTPIFIDSAKVQNMLKLISVFSGAIDGGPAAQVDMGNDVSGVLPVIHGGTGLNTVGASGTVLMSSGGGLVYSFMNTTLVSYSPGTPSKWAGTAPSTTQQALDRMAALLFTLNGSVAIP